MDTIRPFLSRFLSPFIASFCGWLAVKYAVTIDSEQQKQLIEAIVTIIIPMMMLVNNLFHRVIDKRFNPGDAASAHLAVSEKHEATRMKARNSA